MKSNDSEGHTKSSRQNKQMQRREVLRLHDFNGRFLGATDPRSIAEMSDSSHQPNEGVSRDKREEEDRFTSDLLRASASCLSLLLLVSLPYALLSLVPGCPPFPGAPLEEGGGGGERNVRGSVKT